MTGGGPGGLSAGPSPFVLPLPAAEAGSFRSMQGAQLPLWVSAAAAVLTFGLAALLVYLGLAMRCATEARLGLLEHDDTTA